MSNPWDAAGVIRPYSEQIDIDALAVLRCVVAKKGTATIAKETGLSESYVELLQTVFCSADWCDYGTSPRHAFMIGDGNARVAEYENYIQENWKT